MYCLFVNLLKSLREKKCLGYIYDIQVDEVQKLEIVSTLYQHKLVLTDFKLQSWSRLEQCL